MGCFHSRIAFWMKTKQERCTEKPEETPANGHQYGIGHHHSQLSGRVGWNGCRHNGRSVGDSNRSFFFVWRCLKRSQNRNFSLGVVVIPRGRFLETTSSKEKFVLFFQSSMEPQKPSTETRCASESHLKTLSSKKNTT